MPSVSSTQEITEQCQNDRRMTGTPMILCLPAGDVQRLRRDMTFSSTSGSYDSAGIYQGTELAVEGV
jgi:hypothetical protein